MKFTLNKIADIYKVTEYISNLDFEKGYNVTINERKTIRSLDQNKLYWLWIKCISIETGNDKNDLHDYFKSQFIVPEHKEIFGKTIEVRTTTDKSTKQFKEYLDYIQMFASRELSIKLPDPKDKEWEPFYDYYNDRL